MAKITNTSVRYTLKETVRSNESNRNIMFARSNYEMDWVDWEELMLKGAVTVEDHSHDDLRTYNIAKENVNTAQRIDTIITTQITPIKF